MPGDGRRPLRISCGTTRFTTSTGIAKPTPDDEPDSDRSAVFTPMRRPAESSSGPPELPGLIAASVWITSTRSCASSVGTRRCMALTMPVDMAWPSPNGLPIVKVAWPTCKSAEEPIGIGGSDGAPSSRSTARS
jgi:hypothetical protein